MKKLWLLLTLCGLLLAGGAAAQSGGELLDAKGCLGCHAADSRKVGPSWKDVAAKYSGDNQAEAKLAAKLKEGSGHPVKAEASGAELRAMLKVVLSAPAARAKPQAKPAAPALDNATCLGCHGNEGFTMPGPDGRPRPLHVVKEKFELSVHAKRRCVHCHQDITEIPHKKTGPIKVSCVQCHQALWKTAEEEGK